MTDDATRLSVAGTAAGAHDPTRRVLAVTGTDREEFLQGLVTNDLRRLKAGPVYAALLTPQGKYLADFLLVAQGDAILIDVHADLAEALARRLAMYRLRADVQIADSGLAVTRGLGEVPPGAVADPRDPRLGWRLYAAEPGTGEPPDWTAIRVAAAVPESGIELIPDDTYILEAGFERLNGVDFRKGCYVGQEVTARMKHKTELRKGLVSVRVEGTPPAPGSPILTADGREAGRLFSCAGGRGLAHLRFDRAQGPLTAGDAVVEVEAG
ncbi:CAF17-like 4Fe-4S cluster assembly/insertion protein YgfZ [Frigidibacter oleivorans]|uniref:CAF17-like 4Fe-4S cluster assembly/insertion protein YgfZ n=1 Tax=Frigidibacter oleivorans TaxID=2487129 RepID=UPI000F8F3E36|nr:folate-binding protein YgfZ [Frigidibacter oleivorans]